MQHAADFKCRAKTRVALRSIGAVWMA